MEGLSHHPNGEVSKAELIVFIRVLMAQCKTMAWRVWHCQRILIKDLEDERSFRFTSCMIG
jgi:hypothetical protein